MRKLKYLITYDSFIKVLEQFPDVLGDHKDTLEDMKDIVSKGIEKTASDGTEKNGGLYTAISGRESKSYFPSFCSALALMR